MSPASIQPHPSIYPSRTSSNSKSSFVVSESTPKSISLWESIVTCLFRPSFNGRNYNKFHANAMRYAALLSPSINAARAKQSLETIVGESAMDQVERCTFAQAHARFSVDEFGQHNKLRKLEEKTLQDRRQYRFLHNTTIS